jgi:transposase
MAAAELAGEPPAEELRRLIKTDPDPRARQRAQAVLLVEQGHTLASVGRLLEMKPDRVRIWQRRYAAEGRTGLLDRSRRGRPPALDAAATAFVEAALEAGPQTYGLPMTTWTLRDLQALLLRERGLTVSVCTLHRVVHALGYRYRRPRHDLRHRQDAQAVAAAKRVLEWLQKKAYLRPDDPLLQDPLLDPIWSTSMSARSTPIPIWHRSGGSKASP